VANLVLFYYFRPSEIWLHNIFQARRQQRKLNFLITQTELYAHFMAKKMTGESEERQDEILHQLDESKPHGHVAVSDNTMAKRKRTKGKQWLTKYYTENKRSSTVWETIF
jgi:DNA helicase INO80